MPRVRSRVSLRSGFALTCGVLGLLAVLAASALLIIASLLHQNALGLTSAMLREELARDVELDLLLYHQLANLDAAGGHTADLVTSQAQGIQEHFRDAHRLIGTERKLSQLEADTEHYFRIRQDLSVQSLPLHEVIARSDGALQRALGKAAELRTAARADVLDTRGHIQRIAHWANGIALGLGAAVLVSILLFVFAGREFLVRPMRALGHAIQRFGSGDLSVRADEEAPRELRDVAHTFNQMASTIARQRENELTSLAGVAHDLNNPIGVLGMLSEPGEVDRALGSDERLRRRFALVHRQAERIQRLVQDLLDAVRAEAGELQLELRDRDLREIAEGAIELYVGVSELHELRFSAPPSPVITRCDPDRIEQALHNMIGNAIKYSPQGGPVTVHVTTEGGHALLSVSDEGIGLSEEQKARVFEPFQRFGPPGISGAGLGLSLVRRIVRAHGGSVDIDSTPGVGSTFRIRLPLAVVEERRQEQKQAS